jgi:hypothetical protein
MMHEHDNLGDLWLSLSGAFFKCKTQRYVASVNDFNHSLNRVSRDYKEVTLIRK